MKIQIASDLHQEFFSPGSERGVLACAPDADVLVLAGDIGKGVQAVQAFQSWPVPVVLVAGNHEYYDGDLAVVRSAMQEASKGTAVRFLDNETAILLGVRFVGTTLWTDYALLGDEDRVQAQEIAARRLNDHQLISVRGKPFLPSHALAEHERAVIWLKEELNDGSTLPTVVVTHHGPHPGSVHSKYKNDALSPAFCSDLTDLVQRADLWVHGHVHDRFDYQVEGCRVVANPRGYPVASRRDKHGQAFENGQFSSQLVIELS